MSSPPEDPNSPAPFGWEDLADLQAGMLNTVEEERLRLLMEHNPELTQRMLADLAAVESEFPDPPNAHGPLQVPPHVAARWQSAIAREAERRSHGYPAEPTGANEIAPGADNDVFVDNAVLQIDW